DLEQLLPGQQGQRHVAKLLLDNLLVWLRGFLRASWLIKDNCMSCEGAFAIYYRGGSPLCASSNHLYELNITCDGRKREECQISQLELSELIALHGQVEMALYACREEHGDALSGKAS